MKALFLIFHGFNPANGISKKIQYQVDALQACGVDTRLCYMLRTSWQETTHDRLRDFTGLRNWHKRQDP